MPSNDRNAVYAAAQGREFLRGALEDKPNRWIRKFAGLVDDPAILDLLNYYCSVYRERDEEFLETALGRKILRDAATRTTDRAYSEGNVSHLQGMVGLTRSERDAEDALTRTVRELANEGTIAVVTGPPGAGKTATTLDVARAWGAYTGGYICGNTGWDAYDRRVTSDREMLKYMASVRGQVLGVIDEAAQDLTGRGADSKQAEQFANEMTLVRKKEGDHGPYAKRGSILLVSHNWSRMNAPTRRMATLVVAKPSRSDPGKVVLYESPGGEDTRDEIGEFRGLTDTRESYPEHEASSFKVVLEDPEEGPDDGPDEEEVVRREAVRTTLRLVKPWDDSNGLSYPDAADAVDYSSSWVGDRVREWRSGEYRDLVDAPEGETE